MKIKQKSWKDFTPAQQALVIAGGVVELGLLAAALWDLSRRPASQVNGKKSVWVAVSFINFVGPIAYFLRGRRKA